MFKIIHCADLHIDSKMTAHLNKDKAKERKVELLNTFKKMVQEAVTHKANAILIAGDLFDTNKVSALARNTILSEIKNHPEIDFYYERGNHDANNFLNEDNIPDNLYTFGYEWTSYVLNKNGKKNITLTGIEFNKNNATLFYDSLMLESKQFNIVMLHGQESESSEKNDGTVINLKKLKRKNIDYLALGHIHTYKKEKLDARGEYCYPGCLEGRGFDECGEKGFVYIEIDEDTLEYQTMFIPIARRTIYEIEVNITDYVSIEEISEDIAHVLNCRKIHRDSLVRILLTGEIDIECEYSTELLIKNYEHEFYVFEIKDKTKKKVNYQSYINDASLKGEFVRTVMELGCSEEEKAEIIKIGLKMLAGEEAL